MRIATSLLLLLLLYVPALQARDWSMTVQQVMKSMVRIQHPWQVFDPATREMTIQTATCSGFVINAQRGFIMTAHHCLNDNSLTGMVVEPAKAGVLWIVFEDQSIDVAILAAPINAPALRVSRRSLKQGQEIGILGYGMGYPGTIFRVGYVSHPGLETGDIPGPWTLFDTTFIGGMSGGPIFNQAGEVVGIIQMSDIYLGYGRTFNRIYEKTHQYWEKGVHSS